MAASDAAAQRQQLLDAAQALGWPLRDDQATRLLAYLALLRHWNRVYNLTALRDPAEMLTHHLLDCLAVLPPLQHWHARQPASTDGLSVLDVGSGGGLPGVVLAILHPEWKVDCVDTVAKKAMFIRQAAAELQLPQLRGLHARVEALAPPAGGYQLVTSRAFASLADFTGLTRHLLAPAGVWMAMKGKLPTDELAALPPEVEVFHVEHLQVPGLDAQRCLVWMRPSSAAQPSV